MAYLMQPDYVRYVCTCGSLKSISKIYFCRHCLRYRCGYCVCHEVDSHYCPNCLENLATSEVRHRKNKCSNCFNCPCCFQTLSVRTGQPALRSSTPKAGDDVPKPMKKNYYMVCSLCRWSTRDSGIPDQAAATGSWSEPENPYTQRINALIDYHKILVSKEKALRERKKFQSKRNYLQFEKFGITSAMARKRAGRPALPEPQLQSNKKPPPSVATEEVEELLPSIFTEALDINTVTTLEQRIQQLESQPENVFELRPRKKQVFAKRSQRCRSCEHNVSKPDVSSQSIKFKIQLAAFYHIPEVRIVTCEPLRAGKMSELILKFCNPTQHQTQIALLPLDTPTMPIIKNADDRMEEVKRDNMQLGSESPNLMPSVVRQPQIPEDPKSITVVPNADIVLPSTSVIIPQRDDTAEYDDSSDSQNFQDDPKLVVWRKGNKVILRLKVTPHDTEENKEGEPVIVGFVMQHGYVNTIAALENKEPQKLDLRTQMFLTIGNLVGSTS